jgi:diguanylate cyclase (GGDEF)-like protein
MGTVKEMRHQALHDALTGLHNRVLFVDHLTLALAQLSRHPSRLAVLFLDLDNFKLINDSLGHSTGDEVLRHAARMIDGVLRPGDTVARLGGDEFVVLATALDEEDDATLIAHRIANSLRAPFTLGGREHWITASIGIAVTTGVGRSADDLISDADAAMYEAKDRGRDRFEAFDDTLRAEVTSRLQIANELSRALHLGELRVDYQPIVTLEDGRMRGAEALARWRHPTRGEISPAEFIPVAEETGAILEIGEFVLREACAAAAGWHAAHPELPRTTVSVNVSLRQVRQPGLSELVASVLQETGLPPAALHLEITESVLMDETGTSMLTLHALKQLGVCLVLDDFGTGYSSLAHVRRFPLDTIKIDRAFVGDLDGDGDSSTIIEAIVNMAFGLRLDVIAEGVETQHQARRLRDLRCELAQGWLYAPAVPVAEIAGMIGRRLAAASS